MKHLTNIFKLLFFVILFSSVMTTQALAITIMESEPNNDCANTQILTISNGSNIVAGTFENTAATADYYQFTVPADGTITITWQNTDPAANKKASMLVGTGCDDVNMSSIYSGTTLKTTHTTNSIVVHRYDVIFIKIYNGDGKTYTLNIDYGVDISGLTEEDYKKPNFCFEYSSYQGTTPINITEEPRIEDNTTVVGTPIDINLVIRNLGNSSGYRFVENAIVDITDINASQAAYEADGILVKEARVFEYEYIPNSELDTSTTYIRGIDVGDIPTMDSFTIRYQLTPKTSELNFPLNATITYGLAVEIGDTSVLTSHTINLEDMDPCENLESGYSPAYSIFNVELDSLNSETANGTQRIYNLPTQTAMRADNFEVVSYHVDDVFTTNAVSTLVAVELIEVLYDNVYESCANEDSAISPRIWLAFTGTAQESNVTHIPFNAVTIQDAINNGAITDQIYPSLTGAPPISEPGQFYSSARENVAFRVVYNALKDGDELVRLVKTSQGLRIDNFPELVQDIEFCKQEVRNPQNNTVTDRVSVACSNDGNNLTQTEVATCMECIYGYNTRYLCSRDNFAIRPESFRVSLSDQSQQSPGTQSHIKTNLDNNRINIVAGYQYKVDVNATNYLNDRNTLGYNQKFTEINATADKHFSFVWNANSSIDPNNCNDISDHDKSMPFYNGLLEHNLSNSQIGEYNLTILDRDWTRHDHHPELLAHHYIHPIHGNVSAYFLEGKDCIADSSFVPMQGTVAGISGGIITNVSGCDIKSKHTRNNGTVTEYTDINTMIYPYKFDLNSSDNDSIAFGNPVTPMAGPNLTRDQNFVYIDTPPIMDANDTNMSYNMNGTFVAAGYDSNVTSNYVTGCYADDLHMTMDFIYNYGDIPSITPFLSYSLKDYNSTNGSVRPLPSSGVDFEVGDHTSTTTPFIIDQNATYFSKDMKGSIRMNLGYNFVRTYNQVLNPRYIEFRDFNITYVTNPANIHADLTNNHQIYGDKILDQNVSFFYGRAKPSKFFYEDISSPSVNTPVSIVIYCGDDDVNNSKSMSFMDCQNRGVQAAIAQTNEANWWLSREHNTNNADGNVVLQIGSITEGAGAPTVTPNVSIFNDTAVDPNINVTSNSTTLPMTVEIDLATSAIPPLLTNRWLIYNEYYNSVPSPFYKVRFIGTSGWAGHGDTGHVVDSNTSIKKNRRLGW